MALKVWLPLNGNLNNLGASSEIIFNTTGTPTIDNNGKIGKCYSFNGSSYFISQKNDFLTDMTECSFACWIKDTYTGNSYMRVFGIGTHKRVHLDITNAGKLRFFVSKNGTNSTFWGAIGTTDLRDSQWHHICGTFNDKESKVYVDGICEATITTGALPTVTGGQLEIGHIQDGIKMTGSLNDLRIYDHCLSALEVKEISQGLVLHYKLDGFNGGIGDNILTGTYYNSYGSSLGISTATNATGKWCGGSGGNGTFSVVEDSSCPVGNLAWCINNNTSGNRDFQQGDQPYVSGQKYTTSFWAKGSGTCLYRSWNTTDGKAMFQKTWTLTSDWTYYTYTFTASAEMETDLCTFHLGVQGKSSISICGMKMETGTTATPWSLSPKDIYKDSIKVIDSSGYGNHGIFIGDLSTDKDSPKYNLSFHFNGNSRIEVPFEPSEDSTFSVAGWFKHIDGTTYYASNTTYNTYICLEGARYFVYPSSGSAFVGNYTSTANTWQHIVLVQDGINSKLKLYINGNLIGQINSTNKVYNSSVLDLGGRQGAGQYQGNISDFRIYATALSENDIKKLYQTPTEIDKKGSWHTHEFCEDDNNLISKNGLLHDSASSEFPLTQHLKYDSNIYIEPDGSAWVHIYHYNNPGAGTFTYGSNMANSVYIDEDRWFNATEICNQLNKWEFLVKYAYTAGETEHKQRWIQSKNPEVATFGDVDAADVTKITSDGYTTVAKFGGLYKLNASDKAYWVMNNGTNGNWWGATGGFKIYSNGTPGYGEATAATVTTTGYNDLYVRIDNNIDLGQNEQAWITKNGIYLGNELIEK